MKVDTSPYRQTHGAEPRGRRDWWFSIGAPVSGLNDDPALYRPSYSRGVPSLPWSLARKHAIAEAKRRGAAFVVVWP